MTQDSAPPSVASPFEPGARTGRTRGENRERGTEMGLFGKAKQEFTKANDDYRKECRAMARLARDGKRGNGEYQAADRKAAQLEAKIQRLRNQ